MKASKIVLGLSLALFFSVIHAFAQDTLGTGSYYKKVHNAVSFLPQYAASKGIRIDYERKLKDTDNWIVVAPQIYLDTKDSYYYYYNNAYSSYETMTGFGINLYYKIIVYKSPRKNIFCDLSKFSLYFAAGPNYQHYSLFNTEDQLKEFVENGITYYEFEQVEVTKPINRYGAVVDTGFQIALERFLFDIYLGVAFKYSTGEDGKMIESAYNDWIDMDYSGILLDGGLRIGFFF